MAISFQQLITDVENGIEALIALLPGIGALVTAVHPSDTAAQVNTAVTTVTNVLTAAGTSAEAIAALVPTVQAVISAVKPAPTPIPAS